MWKAVWLFWFFFFFYFKGFFYWSADWLTGLPERPSGCCSSWCPCWLLWTATLGHNYPNEKKPQTPKMWLTTYITPTGRHHMTNMCITSLCVCVLPGCTERRGAVQCFLMHSGNSCQRHRTAGAPSAARCHSDMPELTHMSPHTQAHTHTHTHRVIIVQGLNLPSVQVIFLIVCLCVCHLMDFLPPVLICHPCNHDNKYS